MWFEVFMAFRVDVRLRKKYRFQGLALCSVIIFNVSLEVIFNGQTIQGNLEVKTHITYK